MQGFWICWWVSSSGLLRSVFWGRVEKGLGFRRRVERGVGEELGRGWRGIGEGLGRVWASQNPLERPINAP